jgi:hypothetical protein
METCFSELDGSLIYSDHVSVRKLEPDPSAGAYAADFSAVSH